MSYRPYYPQNPAGRAPGFLAQLPPVCATLIKINVGVFLLFYVMAIVVCARHYALPHAPVRV